MNKRSIDIRIDDVNYNWELDKMSEIAEYNGETGSMIMLSEECSELSQACMKYCRAIGVGPATSKNSEEICDNMAEEMADVLICLVQAVYASEIPFNDILKWFQYKIDRRLNSIESEKLMAAIFCHEEAKI